MTTDYFIELCKAKIRQYYEDNKIFNVEVILVWYSKTIQNHKCLMIGKYPDTKYFECTYNGEMKELYIDTYQKINKDIIRIKEYEGV